MIVYDGMKTQKAHVKQHFHALSVFLPFQDNDQSIIRGLQKLCLSACEAHLWALAATLALCRACHAQDGHELPGSAVHVGLLRPRGWVGTLALWPAAAGTRRCGWSWKWSDFPYNTGIYYNILGMRRSDKKYRWRVAFNWIWSFSESQGIGLHGVLHFASLPRKGRLAAAATCGMVHCRVRSVAECYGDTWRCCCSFISGAHQDGSYFPIANKDRGLFTGSILDVFLLVLSWSWLFTLWRSWAASELGAKNLSRGWRSCGAEPAGQWFGRAPAACNPAGSGDCDAC